MIRILYQDENGDVLTDLTVHALAKTFEKKAGVLWVDFAEEHTEVVEPILNDSFNFHPLTIDDALRESHTPKLEDWQDYLYLVLRAASQMPGDSEQREAPELDVFLGLNFVVTYHNYPIDAVDQVWELCQKDPRWLSKGTGRLLYRLSDQLVSEAVTAVEQMYVDLDHLEDEIFAAAEPETLEQLFTLKRNVLQLRRIVGPSWDVLNKLSRNDYPVVDEADRIFFRDVYDHFRQLDNLLNDILILVGSALDTYLSVVNNRMNDIMKTLTVITALFMPLAFITGFFGMNFFQSAVPLRAWTGSLAFIIILFAMAITPLIMLWWMRRRAWI
jgi:magnesium transporter